VTSGASIDQRFSFYKHGNKKRRKKVEDFVTRFIICLISLHYLLVAGPRTGCLTDVD